MMKLESFLRSSSPFQPARSASTGRVNRSNYDKPKKPEYGIITSDGNRTVVGPLPSLALPGRLRKLGPSARIDPADGGPKDLEPLVKQFVSSSPKLNNGVVLGSNMNVVNDYAAPTSIRKKLTRLLGPYEKPYQRHTVEDPVQQLLSSSHHSLRSNKQRLSRSLGLSSDTGARDVTPNRLEQTLKLSQDRAQYIFSSPLQTLVKRRPAVEPPITAIQGGELLDELRHRAEALASNEPMLDCFIRLKKAGFMSREPPAEALTPATYTRVTAEVPLHKIAKNGYARNRFGIPYQR